MSARKKLTKHPKKKTMLKGLATFPLDVQEKAIRRANGMRSSIWSLRKRSRKKITPIPTKKVEKKLKQATIRAVGSSRWDYRNEGKGTALKDFLKRLSQFVEMVQGKGATDVYVAHQGVTVMGYRLETDAEFNKRQDKAELEQATIYAAREVLVAAEKKEVEDDKEQQKRRVRENFLSALNSLPKEEVDELLKKHRGPKPKKKLSPSPRRSTAKK